MEYALIVLAVGLVILVLYRKGVFDKKEPDGWFAGPLIRNKNRSVGVKAESDGSFTFPLYPGHINYLTKARGPLTGESIKVKYAIIGSSPLKGTEDHRPATMSVYISRNKINWSGKEDYSRWYCPIEYRITLEEGEHEIEVPLTADWGGAITAQSYQVPEEFAKTLNQPGRWGVVFGGNEGRGHGVYATGPVKFKLISIS